MQPAGSVTQVDRTLLNDVLAVVRALGACTRLNDALDVIASALVDVLGFGAAAVNVTTAEGDLRVETVVGPPGIEALLGISRPMQFWTDILSAAEPWGELRYFSHERDQSLVETFPTWTPEGPVDPGPDAWHPEDALLAPLWDGEHRLLGVLSVDQPRSGSKPDQQQRTVLEVFAAQAAKAIGDAQSRQLADERRREIESRWSLAFEHSPTGVAIVDTKGNFVQVNEAYAAMQGYTREQLLQMNFVELTHPDDMQPNLQLFADVVDGRREKYLIEKRYVRPDGGVTYGLVEAGGVLDESGTVQTVVAQVTDITERKLVEARLAYTVGHDALTGLPNRSRLIERLNALLVSDRSAGVLFCDIDRFRTVNESLGRQTGDEILRAVAQRLCAAVPSECTVGRISGDEFVVLAPGEGGTPSLRELGERLVAAFSRPIEAQGFPLALGIRVGAAASARWQQHADELMREAERALQRAKQQPPGVVEIYDPGQDHPYTVADLRLEQDLQVAVTAGTGLATYLQPIVNVESGSVVGAEALVRWDHPNRGVLLPEDFLPLAEETGLIIPLGLRMIDLGARAAATPGSGAHGCVAVNVSGSQLGRGVLAAAVARALADWELSPAGLHLEITETALVDASARVVQEVCDIAGTGVRIALDDFGTGYSSLSLLRDLPISVVKIDRSFIAPIAEDRRAAALVRSVVGMCNSLGISTVAEGVETRDQLALVSALGCERAQGYLFGHPVRFDPQPI